MSALASLLRTLTLAEFRLRDQGTVLGFLWTLLHPLLMFGVLWAVFGAWMGDRVHGFVGYLLTGVVLWNFFAGATAYGLTALDRRKGLVLYMKCPTFLLVAAAVGSAWLSHLMELGLLAAVLVLAGHPPGAPLLLLPVLLAAETALALGAALALSGLHVRAQDTERVWSILLTAGFFVTPVFYTPDLMPARWRGLLWLNPMTAVLACGRQVFLGSPAEPRAWLLLSGWAALALLGGAALFRGLARDAAERL